ncbi:uncharacterized protein LOC109602047 isoform X2 [Aethina tumida]|nr:uncharacterized protein LOC109602047 isoform X2 [Aethina tumida]
MENKPKRTRKSNDTKKTVIDKTQDKSNDNPKKGKITKYFSVLPKTAETSENNKTNIKNSSDIQKPDSNKINSEINIHRSALKTYSKNSNQSNKDDSNKKTSKLKSETEVIKPTSSTNKRRRSDNLETNGESDQLVINGKKQVNSSIKKRTRQSNIITETCDETDKNDSITSSKEGSKKSDSKNNNSESPSKTRSRQSVDYFKMENPEGETPKRKRGRISNEGTIEEESKKRKRQSNNSIKDMLELIKTENSVKESNLVTDGNVTCAECKINIPADEWADHNTREHYTFGWRLGENQPTVKNTKKNRKVLDDILETVNELNCKKCDLKLTTSLGYLEHLQECGKEKLPDSKVVCGVCKLKIEKPQWQHHKYKAHTNLAWKEGETPLDLNDNSVVMAILNKLYKEKKPLFCEKCGVSKKSVIGFLSHRSMCQLSADELEGLKIKCELCDNRVLPVSMVMHLKCKHKLNPDMTPILTPPPKKNELEDVMETGKRRAHRKALSFIENMDDQQPLQHTHYTFKLLLDEPNVISKLKGEEEDNKKVTCKFKECQIEKPTATEIIDHMKNCDKQPENYYNCKYCWFLDNSEIEVRSHIQIVHNINCRGKLLNDVKDEYIAPVEEQTATSHSSRKPASKVIVDENGSARPKFLIPRIRGKHNNLFGQAFLWTREFREFNYSTSRLFDKFEADKNQWLLLEEMLLDSYLPKSNDSCNVDFAITSGFGEPDPKNISFKNMELFDTKTHSNGYATIFAGGPITAMSWVPTPDSVTESPQFLAVAVQNDPDSQYYHNENYHEPYLIQFWHFGSLRNRSKDPIKPQLAFCLAFDYGPVWHLEWCPSGCYDLDRRRLGLLAVAASDGNVYVYSVPFFSEDEFGLFYKPKPSVVLKFGHPEDHKLSEQKFYATKVSWSQAFGHERIAVGYTNGSVAIFDLTKDSTLLEIQQNSTSFLFPYLSFQAHYHYITGIQILPYSGCSVLVTTSFDRDLCFWDLKTQNVIFAFRKRNIFTCSAWFNNWMGVVTGSDVAFNTTAPCSSSITQVRHFTSNWSHLLPSYATVKDVSTNDWLNCVAHGNTIGEVCTYLGQQFLCGLDSDKRVKFYRKVLSTVKIVPKVPKTDTQTHEPIVYKSAVDKYGVVICDVKADSFKDFPASVENNFTTDIKQGKADTYPLAAVNKVAYNPNLQASTFLATGYHIGFVRIMVMRFLNDDEQVM